MKDILLILIASFKLVCMIVGAMFEKDADKKAKKEEAINLVKDGIKEKDPSKITAGFDSLK